MLKTAVVLFVVAVTAATQDKITPRVVEWLQQSSTANVAVSLHLASHVSGHTSLYNHVKCNTLDAVGGAFQCNGLTKNEICSIAALPEVRQIVLVLRVDSDYTPKPADALTTTAATINLCTPNIIPEPTVTAVAPTTTATHDKITPHLAQWLQLSSTASVAVSLSFDPHVHASFKNNAKCFSIDNLGSFQCNRLNKNEICSIAALPEVRQIVLVLRVDSDYTPKPADALTTTAATINLCTPNIIPNHTTAAATPSACDKPVEDVDYEGNDITSTQRSNSDECCDDCTKTPGCVAYVWTAWNDGTCFLKSKADKSVPKEGTKAAKVVF
ncbi:hypothetical protein H257_13400 [Aphanomyces astaci]|uniref:Apple domain-containing protein n=1 Tax=Aphanomyces astaci TaxID=112090 RepID=W4FUT9_APHAT|nr:hypothetical protein H257_13400 [Aphanomyces astaci]ETV71262.1 hypothetical protein H257_13400 [Aphanomyces astaci]|eukprot:XP_009839202.1 hypothetical protein H257_13400 [Aphanomyces astaci]